ncbi:hypothetical protein FB451DRAFT_1386872 [Mycena latifolia]|nr:hypothetical protein FB451DRAFT_1386872 [Mycena latifolia]
MPVSFSSSVSDAQVASAGKYIIYIVVGILLQTFFFGIYSVLIFLSTRMFLKRGLKMRTNRVMFSVTMFMYLLSAAYYAYSIANVMDRMQIYISTPRSPLSIDFDYFHDAVTKWSGLFNAVVLVNYVISDAVVVWRARIICLRNHRKYLWITIGFLVLTIASVACTIVFRIVAFIESPINDLVPDSVLGKGISILQISNLGLSLLSNLSATAVVGATAWQHRRRIRDAFKDTKQSTKADKVLALMAESGVLYCLSSIANIVAPLIRLPEGTLGDLYLAPSIQISGAYPLIVLLLVSMQQSLSETTLFDTSDSTPANQKFQLGKTASIHFARNPELFGMDEEAELRSSEPQTG